MGLVLKIVFCSISYVFAGSVVAGYLAGRSDREFDAYDNSIACILWPLFVLFLPMRFVYYEIKQMTKERYDKQ